MPLIGEITNTNGDKDSILSFYLPEVATMHLVSSPQKVKIFMITKLKKNQNVSMTVVIQMPVLEQPMSFYLRHKTLVSINLNSKPLEIQGRFALTIEFNETHEGWFELCVNER